MTSPPMFASATCGVCCEEVTARACRGPKDPTPRDYNFLIAIMLEVHCRAMNHPLIGPVP